jgi:hypothetical protein
MEIILLCGIFIMVLLIISIYIKDALEKKRMRYVLRFKSYISVLNYYMDKAYELIHKDKMLVYSLEATKVDDKDLNKYSKEFVVLVSNMIGPMLEKEFIYLYGNESTYYFNLLEYFNSKYEDDEIRKTALDNLTDSST